MALMFPLLHKQVYSTFHNGINCSSCCHLMFIFAAAQLYTDLHIFFFCKNWNLLILEKNQLTVYSAKAVFLKLTVNSTNKFQVKFICKIHVINCKQIEFDRYWLRVLANTHRYRYRPTLVSVLVHSCPQYMPGCLQCWKQHAGHGWFSQRLDTTQCHCSCWTVVQRRALSSVFTCSHNDLTSGRGIRPCVDDRAELSNDDAGVWQKTSMQADAN